MVLANAQPSPEAVALVQAVIRAERECAVEEERNGFTTPSHWALIGKLDATTEALFDKMVQDERDAARSRFLRDNRLQLRAVDGNAGWAGQMTAEQFDAHTDIAATLGAGAAA